MATRNTIHPTAVIGDDVDLGEANTVGPYAVILGGCRIGDGNWIGPHVSIGTPAQMRGGPHPGWDAPAGDGVVTIGAGNVIREYVTIHQPTDGGSTSIGNDCYLMAYGHVPHDATVGDGATISNAAQIGGHTTIGPAANIGLGAMVHQRLAIGGGAMIGMGSVVTKDVPPYAIAYGNPARVAGVNVVGMRRSGYDDATIEQLAAHYRDHSSELPPGGLPASLLDVFAAHDAAVRQRH